MNNTMQVNTWASFVLIVLMAPSFPSLGLPSAVDAVMRLVPTYYLTEALKLSMAGTASSQYWIYSGVLLGSTIVAFAAAVWALKRRSK